MPAFEQFIKGLLARAPATQISFFNQSLRLAPAFQRARLGLWAVHTAQGEHQRALDVVRQVPIEHPLGRRARFLASLSLVDLNQFAPAADALAELHRQRPDAALVNNLGSSSCGVRRVGRWPGPRPSSPKRPVPTPRTPTSISTWDTRTGSTRDLPAAIEALREVVRRDPADGDAHFVLGVALQVSGSAVEAGREKELARQLSSNYAEWEARPGGGTTVPRGLERVKTEIDVPAALRVNDVIVPWDSESSKTRPLSSRRVASRLYQSVATPRPSPHYVAPSIWRPTRARRTSCLDASTCARAARAMP